MTMTGASAMTASVTAQETAQETTSLTTARPLPIRSHRTIPLCACQEPSGPPDGHAVSEPPALVLLVCAGGPVCDLRSIPHAGAWRGAGLGTCGQRSGRDRRRGADRPDGRVSRHFPATAGRV